MSYLLWSPQVELMKNQLCEVRLECMPLTSALVGGIVQATHVGLSVVPSPVSRPDHQLSKVFVRSTSFFAF